MPDAEWSSVPAHDVKVGDRVRGDGAVLTIAVSEPDDLNPGGWHLEAEEATPSSGGWPWSTRYLPGTLTVEVARCG